VRILITGATGFAGRHLTHYLAANQSDAELHGTTLRADAQAPLIQLHCLDLKDNQAVLELLRQLAPDQIFHLAAQASPRRSFADAWSTLENNIKSQLNIFEACLKSGQSPRILVVTSGEIYQASDYAIDETMPFNPTSPYGVSKIAQDMLALQFYQTHHLPIMRARPFNHMGPGQSEGFVAPDFAFQIARIEAGMQAPVLEVGNLAARRDFTDVRDVVHAYHCIVEQGQPGDVYNIAAGMAHSIQTLLDTLLSFSTSEIDVRVDRSRFLPIDVPLKLGDAHKLRSATGWQPTFSFEQTLLDLLNDCRQRLSAQELS
jgi:GDP-4-dehydro-6-deoxy-D-mannose reductase